MDTVASLKTRVEHSGNVHGSTLANTIAVLIGTCEHIPRQRKNVKGLRKQCVSLLELLGDGLSDEPPTPDVLEPAMLEINRVVWNVHDRVRHWEKMPRWKTVLHTGSLDDDAASSVSDIDRAAEKLQSLFPCLSGPMTCPNCKSRPVAPSPTMGRHFRYCSKACAMQAKNPNQNQRRKEMPSVTTCRYCKLRPQLRDGETVRPYCSLTCTYLAETATLSGVICQTPGCASPASIGKDGTPSNYCTMTHEEWGERGCTSCRVAPMNSPSTLCQPCHNDALSNAPVIVEVPQDHESYKSVESQFQQTWRHRTTCPEVKTIYKIIIAEESLKQYQQYLDDVEARGNFVAMGKARGNENRRWHGTKRRCNLGDPGIRTFCAQEGCSLCCIVKASFDLGFFKAATGWGRFGHGIYTSSTSSKANDYSKNLGITSEWKALLLNKVVVGHGKKLTRGNKSLAGPPPGYDSILGEVGGSLNYDELVVYQNDAVRPSYLVMYASP